MLLWLCAVLMSLSWVIPPGQEARLQQMLSPGAGWPTGWRLVSSRVQQDVVVAHYQRGDEAAVQVTLRHPTTAAPDAIRTPVVSMDRSALPEDASAALRAQLEVQAGDWLWQSAAEAPPLGQATPTTADPPVADDPAAQVAAAQRALTRSEALPALERARAQLAIAWQLRQRGDASATGLFQRHTATAGHDAESALLRWSARLGATGRAGDLEPTGADEATALCQAATAVAEEVSRGAPSAALGLLAEVTRRAPTCRAAALHAARLAQVIGAPDVAMQALQPLLQRHPEDLELALTMANLERQADRLDAALQRLLRLDLRRMPADSALVLPLTRVLIDAVGAQLPAALAFAEAIAARSDQDPADAVAAFIAGTIEHHAGRWQASNRFLARSEKAFANEPRQFLYSAMNHLHLGDQAEAERRVSHAFRMGTHDPDVWYCRAMIFARSRPQQALEDLGKYLAAVKGTADNPARKSDYVADVMQDLEACRDAGDAGRCLDLRHARTWAAKQWPSVAGVAALGLLAGWLWRRRRAAAGAHLALGLGLATLTALVHPAAAFALTAAREAVAPRTLEAQLSWLTPLELVQVGVCAALIAASAVFFCRWPALSPRRWGRCRAAN